MREGSAARAAPPSLGPAVTPADAPAPAGAAAAADTGAAADAANAADALVPSHGGRAIWQVVPRRDAPAAAHRVGLDAVAVADLRMLATGAYAPLTGFLGAADSARVAAEMRLVDGTCWPIPIALPVADARAVRAGDTLLLCDGDADGRPLGELACHEIYTRDPAAEARAVYGTESTDHPGVAQLLARGNTCVAGDVLLYEDAVQADRTLPCLTPAACRRALAARGWRRVVGFQTRNPIHRAHEYILKCALEICDGLLLHPLVGPTKADDIPAAVRMDCYAALIGSALPAHSVLLAALAAPMRYAGPREAVLHAIVRQNFGCSDFIVGRDHAGVGRYYGTYDAQRIFLQLPPGALRIRPMCFEHTFYCRDCAGVASPKTCPHQATARLLLSGSEVRAMLRRGEQPPPEFTRAAVASRLGAWARGR